MLFRSRGAVHEQQVQRAAPSMSRRRLSDDERALWRGFARGVTPLRRNARTALGAPPDQSAREALPPAQSVPKERAHAKQPPALTSGSIFTA